MKWVSEMGLLEKALTYKNEINKKGHETVMDKIAGPASTDFIYSEESHKEDSVVKEKTGSIENEVVLLVQEDLTPVDDKTDGPIIDSGGDSSPGKIESMDDDLVLEDHDFTAEFESTIENEEIDDQMLEEFALEGNKIQKTLAQSRDILDETPDKFENVMEEVTEINIGEVSSSAESHSGVIIEDTSGGLEFDENIEVTGSESDSAEYPVESNNDPGDMDQSDVGAVGEERLIQFDRDSVISGGFDDYLLLYETEKEINSTTTLNDLYEIILFNLMGQIGSSTSSLLIPDSADEDRWVMALSRGVTIDSKGLFFEAKTGFLKNLSENLQIIDIDELKEDPEYGEDYHHFLSIDARYIAPISYGEKLLAVVILGDKVTVEDYSIEDKEFIKILCEAAGITLNNLTVKIKLQKEIDGLRDSIRKYREIDWFQEQIKQEKVLIRSN